MAVGIAQLADELGVNAEGKFFNLVLQVADLPKMLILVDLHFLHLRGEDFNLLVDVESVRLHVEFLCHSV